MNLTIWKHSLSNKLPIFMSQIISKKSEIKLDCMVSSIIFLKKKVLKFIELIQNLTLSLLQKSIKSRTPSKR